MGNGNHPRIITGTTIRYLIEFNIKNPSIFPMPCFKSSPEVLLLMECFPSSLQSANTLLELHFPTVHFIDNIWISGAISTT